MLDELALDADKQMVRRGKGRRRQGGREKREGLLATGDKVHALFTAPVLRL